MCFTMLYRLTCVFLNDIKLSQMAQKPIADNFNSEIRMYVVNSTLLKF